MLPNWSNSASSITDIAPVWSDTSAKCFPMDSRAHSFYISLRMFVQRFLKKLKEVWPSKANMANQFAEAMPSLRNFMPWPGAVLGIAGSVSENSEILMTACLQPLKMPVYG